MENTEIIAGIRSGKIKLTIAGKLWEAAEGTPINGDRVFDTGDMTHGTAEMVTDKTLCVREDWAVEGMVPIARVIVLQEVRQPAEQLLLTP